VGQNEDRRAGFARNIRRTRRASEEADTAPQIVHSLNETQAKRREDNW